MADAKMIQTLEELRKFQNEKGIIEIALRGKNKKFRAFQKIALDQLQQNEVSEKLKQAISIINKTNHISEKSLKALESIANLSKLNIVLSGLNLCATCAGFAIMYQKLEKMSGEITGAIIEELRKGEAIHTSFEFNKVLSEHSNMLDCRKKQNYYTEDQMRELVDAEFNVLALLMDTFKEKTSANREELLFSILSLAQMLSVSLRYFDETYFFKYKETIRDGNRWHISHDKWVTVFDKLTSTEFIEKIQDYGIFEKRLNTVENDIFYISFYDQIKSLKQDIEDNQALIEAIDDEELFSVVMKKTSEDVRSEIEAALNKAGVPIETCEEYIRVAVA